MEGFLDSPELLDSRQFQIAVKRLADSLTFGTDRSPHIGSVLDITSQGLINLAIPLKRSTGA